MLSTRTMELVRSWGLEERVLAGGVDVDWLMWSCNTLAEAGEGVRLEEPITTIPERYERHPLLREQAS